jgi:hypothetical protein
MERRSRGRWAAVCGAVALIALFMGCSSEPQVPPKISAVDLSHEIDEHNEPRSARETFAPTSTIYASIAVEGNGPATLTAKWTDPTGKVMAEQDQKITVTKPARYEFHLLPEGGWQKSDERYKVVVDIDGKEARTREFGIR